MLKTRYENGFVVLCAMLALIIIGLANATYPAAAPAWQHAARWTADLSAVLFLSLFTPTLRDLGSAITMRSRAIAFLAVHIIHAGAFTTYHLTTQGPALRTIIMGGLGYLLAASLPFISPIKRPRLHGFGQWYLWFIFTATFAAGFKNPERVVTSSAGVCMMLLAAAWKIRHMIQRRRDAWL
jgi:hypothetical protein